MIEDLADRARRALADTGALVTFLSRLPWPAALLGPEAHAAPSMARSGWATPIAAIVIAAPAAFVLAALGAAGAPDLLAATLAVATLAATTGGLHEDGLADMADACSGGSSRERRLEIMRDPRIGAHGALALLIAVALRIAALAAMLGAGWGMATAAFLAAAAFSRLASIAMLRLPPARADGKGQAVGAPASRPLLIGAAATLAAIGAAAVGGGAVAALGAGLIAMAAAAFALRRLALRLLGGVTGDVCGAQQQVSETAFLVGFALIHA
jgi:adenosylcobinamide-GDP ribazoletransferase